MTRVVYYSDFLCDSEAYSCRQSSVDSWWFVIYNEPCLLFLKHHLCTYLFFMRQRRLTSDSNKHLIQSLTPPQDYLRTLAFYKSLNRWVDHPSTSVNILVLVIGCLIIRHSIPSFCLSFYYPLFRFSYESNYRKVIQLAIMLSWSRLIDAILRSTVNGHNNNNNNNNNRQICNFRVKVFIEIVLRWHLKRCYVCVMYTIHLIFCTKSN